MGTVIDLQEYRRTHELPLPGEQPPPGSGLLIGLVVGWMLGSFRPKRRLR